MPRIIFKCPYLKGGTLNAAAHLENLVGYIATRNGVEKIDPGKTLLPATKKQAALVDQLLQSYPQSRESFEYEDYLANPNRGNASALIAMAIEQNLSLIAHRGQYMEYIAKRPRAQRFGAHGLFTGTEDSLVLSQVAEAVAHHPGNVWLPIISLRREDAARLGYDNAENWRPLLTGYAMEMAAAMKIPWEQFRWYAAFHDESHHPHVHMVCYSEDPSKGYLTKTGIAKIKSGLASEIFRQELTELYSKQTESRNDLTQESKSVMEQLVQKMQSGMLENSRIEQLMEYLAHRLRQTSGKKQYGYLKAPLKSVVDEIVDELARDPRISEAYRIWYELREDVLRTYKDDLPPRLPLYRQKEFKRIKNLIIEEAVHLGEYGRILTEADEMADSAEPIDGVPPAVESAADDFLPDVEPPDDDPTEAEEPPSENETAPSVKWSAHYKQARKFLFGDADQPQDFEQALTLFSAEALAGNALAMHDLGRMTADGLGCEMDPEQAREWYAKALAAFLAVEEQKPGPYVEYRVGKMYAAGLGSEKDFDQAAKWLSVSAAQGYKYAQYSLAGLYCRGQGVEQDYEKALLLYTQAAEQDFPYASYELGKLYRDGTGCEKDDGEASRNFENAFTGFRVLEQNSHDDRLQYRIGWMLLHGVGTAKDEAEARDWFEKSARLDNPHAQYQLAKMILADDASEREEIGRALEWLTKAAEAGQDCAQYALGKLYRDGGAVKKDVAKAVSLFEQAVKQDNGFAAYALGKLFLDGVDGQLDRDIPTALHWLRRAAELGNQFAQYRVGKILLRGEVTQKDSAEAIRWLTAAADQGNAFAEYVLAMVYIKGEDAPQNTAAASELLRRSAGRGNQYAQYRLGKLLLQGELIPKGILDAIRWLTASAEQGNPFAQYALGKLYLLGKEVPRDKEAAVRWFTLAAAQGNEYAQYFLSRMNDPPTAPLLQTATRLLHHMGNIFREQTPPPSSGGLRVAVDRKLLRKIMEKKAALGHKRDDHEPTMTL